MSRARGKFACLVCARRGLDEPPDGFSHEICLFCGWQDDTTDPEHPSGANGGATMNEWRRGYRNRLHPPPRGTNP